MPPEELIKKQEPEKLTKPASKQNVTTTTKPPTMRDGRINPSKQNRFGTIKIGQRKSTAQQKPTTSTQQPQQNVVNNTQQEQVEDEGKGGIIWRAIKNFLAPIASSLGLKKPLEIIDGLAHVFFLGSGTSIKTFGKTLIFGVGRGVKHFFKNIIPNLLRIGADLINMILPKDCPLKSFDIAGIANWLIRYFRADGIITVIKVLYEVRKDTGSWIEVLKTIGDMICKSILSLLTPSSIVKMGLSSVKALLTDNPAVKLVLKYVDYLMDFLGGAVKTIGACCDGAVDLVSQTIENMIIRIPALIGNILFDVFLPGTLESIESIISMPRDLINLESLMKIFKGTFKEDVGEKVAKLKANFKARGKDPNSPDFITYAKKYFTKDEVMKDVSWSDFGMKVAGTAVDEVEDKALHLETDGMAEKHKGTTQSQTGTGQPAQKSKKEKFVSGMKKVGGYLRDNYVFEDDFVKAIRGEDEEESKGKEKAKGMPAKNHTVKFFLAGKKIPGIKPLDKLDANSPEAKVLKEMGAENGFKEQRAHVSHYVVYNSSNVPVYRTPVADRAEKAIRVAEGWDSKDAGDSVLGTVLGVNSRKLAYDNDGNKLTGKAYMKNMLKQLGSAATDFG